MGGPVEKQNGVVPYRQSVGYHSKQNIVKTMQVRESGKKTGLSIPKVQHSN
jgi:hypothetical protein